MVDEKRFRGHRLESEITLKGLPLKVEYVLYRGCPATDDEPEVYDDIDVEAVWIDGHDIYHLCGDKTMDKIVEELFKIVDKEK